MAKSTGGGASAKLEEYWDWAILDMNAVRQTLGVMGPYFLDTEVTAAVERTVKADLGHKVPGLRVEKRSRAAVSSRTVKPA